MKSYSLLVTIAVLFQLLVHSHQLSVKAALVETKNLTDASLVTEEDNSEWDIVCPRPYLWFCPFEKLNFCKNDSECAVDQKCCNIGCYVFVCQRGVATKPKVGRCPAPKPRGMKDICMMDYGGCRHDDDCRMGQKCCPSPRCSYYNECLDPSTE